MKENNLRKLTYREAIHEALNQSMEINPLVFIIGEGVPDPNGIFGTTVGLKEKYGGSRVLDMPLSENAMTGVCIGAALVGMRPIMIHQRIDFSLLALDQIMNNAAKWHYIFGGQSSVPLIIRLIIGRGWGQGAQHSQNLQALFAHTPGLKVLMPSTAYDAKGLLISSVEDNNPVIFIEHRWLYNTLGLVPKEYYKVPIGKGKIVQEGADLTIAATSYMTIEALKAADYLKKENISVEVIDVRTLKPLDDELIINSVKKTGRLLVLDLGYYTGGFAGEIIARVVENIFENLKSAPQRVTLPDISTPTTRTLTKYYYPTHVNIIKKVLEMLSYSQEKIKNFLLLNNIDENIGSSDVPDKDFIGPF
jgi:pyruvate dehydrogenase E1 component beta subunit